MSTSLPRAAEAFTQLTRALGGAFDRTPIDETIEFLKGTLKAHEQDTDVDIDARVALAIMLPPKNCCAVETVTSRINRAVMLLEWPLVGRKETMPQQHLDFLRVFLTDLDQRLHSYAS